ncbi:MAG: sigma-70 family RNA polymerase sigma factor [Flammeovirgaceae bacterium]
MFLGILRKKSLSDAELLEKYQQTSDLNYLGELYERYTHLVFGVCLKYLKNEDDSKDAVMQIFEKLIHSVRQQKIENFQKWLYVVVKNHCLMELRSAQSSKKLHTSSLEEERFFMENESPLHPIADDIEEEKEEALSQIEMAISLLPDEQRICVEMFYLKEKCYKEIEAITGYPLNKVKSYIQNGKRNLKILMMNLKN